MRKHFNKNIFLILFLLGGMIGLLTACSSGMNEHSAAAIASGNSGKNQLANGKTANMAPTIDVNEFGTLPDGRKISVYTLTNNSGTEVKIINYGGIITSLKTKAKNGEVANIVHGFDELQPYLDGTPYFGATIGRYTNRIDDAKFKLNDTVYQLDENDGKNHLHGGGVGFDKRVWSAARFSKKNLVTLRMQLISQDGDQGYPGTVTAKVTYTLTNDNELNIEYSAITNKPTIVNMTHHSYFNLAGSGDILDQVLQIDADTYTPIDDTLIPTGEFRNVQGTPFDFREPKPIGRDINTNNQQLVFGKGYDHNFVLNQSTPGKYTESASKGHNHHLSPSGHQSKTFARAARLTDPVSGRVLEVWTDAPGLQLYSGNTLDGSLASNGRVYSYRSAICLEPQHFPDSPNQPNFPSTALNHGEMYSSHISYRFSTVDG